MDIVSLRLDSKEPWDPRHDHLSGQRRQDQSGQFTENPNAFRPQTALDKGASKQYRSHTCNGGKQGQTADDFGREGVQFSTHNQKRTGGCRSHNNRHR